MNHFKNILFIAVDDLRPDFGKKKLHTPHLDQLAQRSTQFDRAYCQIPICMPSRASLMSGVRPTEIWRDRIHQLCPSGEPSLPHYLKQNGFTTISIGKVYHYNDDDEAAWSKRYTDTFYEKEYTTDGYCSGYQLAENQRKVKNFAELFASMSDQLPAICESSDAPDAAYPDGMIADRATEVLQQLHDDNAPFFLALGFYRPHLPWAVPQKYWDLYQRDEVDLADNPFFPKDGIGISDLSDFLHYGDSEINETYSDIGRYSGDDFPTLSESKQRECVHAYWASVSFTDAQIGKVLTELNRLDMQDDTVIVLWSDNGWHLGEHKLWSKVTSFEESTRVPLLISVPGMTRGERTAAFAELVDLYPTLCALTGLDTPTHLEGISLTPVLQNPTRALKKGVFSRINDAETVRTTRYRFTRYANSTSDGNLTHLPNIGQYELFDLLNDPQENVNIAKHSDAAHLVAELDSLLDAGWRAMLPNS